MRTILLAAAALAVAGGPVLAQTADAPAKTVHHKAKKAASGHTGEKPIDNGPDTPEANRAYDGGGVVLEGPPGAPAPKPQATPPVPAPRNGVPQ